MDVDSPLQSRTINHIYIAFTPLEKKRYWRVCLFPQEWRKMLLNTCGRSIRAIECSLVDVGRLWRSVCVAYSPMYRIFFVRSSLYRSPVININLYSTRPLDCCWSPLCRSYRKLAVFWRHASSFLLWLRVWAIISKELSLLLSHFLVSPKTVFLVSRILMRQTIRRKICFLTLCKQNFVCLREKL